MVLNKCISMPKKKGEESSDTQEILYSYEFIEDQCEEEKSIHLSSLHLRNRREDNENAPEGDERNGEQIELGVVQLHVQENTAVAAGALQISRKKRICQMKKVRKKSKAQMALHPHLKKMMKTM